jgi:hypothetical protein
MTDVMVHWEDGGFEVGMGRRVREMWDVDDKVKGE